MLLDTLSNKILFGIKVNNYSTFFPKKQAESEFFLLKRLWYHLKEI